MSITKSDLSRLVKKIIQESEKGKIKSIEFNSVKEIILKELSNTSGLSKMAIKRRIGSEINEYAEDIIYHFQTYLDYISEEGKFKDLLEKLDD